MPKRLTLDIFKERANAIHGVGTYDYSLIKEYKNNSTKVPIICNRCGSVFEQRPNDHISKKCGCSMCNQRHFSLVCGVGINDLTQEIQQTKGVVSQSYKEWHLMLNRCYNEKLKERLPTYQNCSVCDEWLYFSNFKKWFDNPENGYIDGYALDKDILVKGNKVYSPDTCCFVPKEINVLFTKRQNKRGEYPIGVFRNGKGFGAKVNINGKSKRLGTFKSIEIAFNKYKQEKESHIKEIAQKYFNNEMITKRVYDALMRYEVEITD